MSAYRKPPAALSVAPPAPWWHLLRAWAGGTFKRLARAKESRRAWVVLRRNLATIGWDPREYARLRDAITRLPATLRLKSPRPPRDVDA